MAGERQASARDEASDEALAERVRLSGDVAAFAVLVARYRSRVIALSRRMLGPGGWDEGEDVAQEAFVAAYDKRASFGAASRSAPGCIASPSTAAWTACAPRPAARARGYRQLCRSRALSGGDPMDALLAEESEARLEEAVAALPPKLRAVFLLRHLDDLSYDEIALATGLPMGTVKTHLFRARAQLRAGAGGVFGDHELPTVRRNHRGCAGWITDSHANERGWMPTLPAARPAARPGRSSRHWRGWRSRWTPKAGRSEDHSDTFTAQVLGADRRAARSAPAPPPLWQPLAVMAFLLAALAFLPHTLWPALPGVSASVQRPAGLAACQWPRYAGRDCGSLERRCHYSVLGVERIAGGRRCQRLLLCPRRAVPAKEPVINHPNPGGLFLGGPALVLFLLAGLACWRCWRRCLDGRNRWHGWRTRGGASGTGPRCSDALGAGGDYLSCWPPPLFCFPPKFSPCSAFSC